MEIQQIYSYQDLNKPYYINKSYNNPKHILINVTTTTTFKSYVLSLLVSYAP